MTGEEFDYRPSDDDSDDPDVVEHPFGIIAVWAFLALLVGMAIGAVWLSVGA